MTNIIDCHINKNTHRYKQSYSLLHKLKQSEDVWIKLKHIPMMIFCHTNSWQRSKTLSQFHNGQSTHLKFPEKGIPRNTLFKEILFFFSSGASFPARNPLEEKETFGLHCTAGFIIIFQLINWISGSGLLENILPGRN